MKKYLLLLTILCSPTTATAQQWKVNDGELTLIACHRQKDGVYCDFNFKQTKRSRFSIDWWTHKFKVELYTGASVIANAAAFKDGQFGRAWSSSHKLKLNEEAKVEVRFTLPKNISKIKSLTVEDISVSHIQIYNQNPPNKSNKPPSSAVVAGFTVTFGNCKPHQKKFICTAVFSPKK